MVAATTFVTAASLSVGQCPTPVNSTFCVFSLLDKKEDGYVTWHASTAEKTTGVVATRAPHSSSFSGTLSSPALCTHVEQALEQDGPVRCSKLLCTVDAGGH
jgi:hypothetical protein